MYNSSVTNMTDLGDSNTLICKQNDGNYEITINNLEETNYCFLNLGLGIETRLECDKFSTMLLDKTGTLFTWFSTAGWFENIAYCGWYGTNDGRYLTVSSESFVEPKNGKHTFKFYTHDSWTFDANDFIVTSNGIQFPFFYDDIDYDKFLEYREKYKSFFAYLNTRLYNPMIQFKLHIKAVNTSQKTIRDYWALCTIVDVNDFKSKKPNATIFNTITIDKITDYNRYLSIDACLTFINSCESITIETCEVMVRPSFKAIRIDFVKTGLDFVDVHKSYVVSGNYTSDECKQLEWLKEYHWVCDGTLSYAHTPYAYIDNWKSVDGGYNFDVVLGNCFLHYLEFVINSEDYEDDMYKIDETQVFVNFQQLEILLNNLLTEGGEIDFIENQDNIQSVISQMGELVVNQKFDDADEEDDIITEGGDVAVNEDSMTFTESEYNDAIGILDYKYDKYKYKGVNDISEYYSVDTKYDSKFYHNTKQGFYIKAVYNITCSSDSLGKILHIIGDTFDNQVNLVIEPPITQINHTMMPLTNGTYGNTKYKLFDAIKLDFTSNGKKYYPMYSDLKINDCHSKSVEEVQEIAKDSYGNILYYRNTPEDIALYVENGGNLDNVVMNDDYIRDKVSLKRIVKIQKVNVVKYDTSYHFNKNSYEPTFLFKNGLKNYDIQGNMNGDGSYVFYFLGHTDTLNDVLVDGRTQDEQQEQKQPPFGFNDGVKNGDVDYEGGVLNFHYSIPLGWLRFVEHDFDYEIVISNKIKGVEIYNSVDGDEQTKNASDKLFKYSGLRMYAKNRMSPRVDFDAWGSYASNTIYTNKTPTYAVSGYFVSIEDVVKTAEGYIGDKEGGKLNFNQVEGTIDTNTFSYVDYYNSVNGTINSNEIKELQFSATITPSKDVSNQLVINLV